MTGVQHPLVQDYLARLEQASWSLPPQARAELLADLHAHLESAVTGDLSDADVRNTLQQLGSPEDVVSAAHADLDPAAASAPTTPVASSYTPGYTGGYAPASTSPWGQVEIWAVICLVAGMFVLPVLGPAIGLVLVWLSARWSTREKAVATVLTCLPVITVVLAGLTLLVTTSGGTS